MSGNANIIFATCTARSQHLVRKYARCPCEHHDMTRSLAKPQKMTHMAMMVKMTQMAMMVNYEKVRNLRWPC